MSKDALVSPREAGGGREGGREGEHSGGGAEDVALRAENSFLGVNDFSADLHFYAFVK